MTSRATSGCGRPISASPMTRTSRSLRMLNLADVHVHYGKLHILQGVSMQVNEGEAVALLGRNGVGKTTTLRAIMGLVPRSAGTVRFGGTGVNASERDR